jgi:CRP-like cAMP-binding protein
MIEKLSIVEKVIFLQGIEIFDTITTQDLSHLAAISEQLEYAKEETIYNIGEASDAMYVVISGEVLLSRDNNIEVMRAKRKDAFGTWSLFDDEPRVVSAVATKPTILLIIKQEEFIDLLADNVQITRGIMKSIVNRLRRLMEVIKK